MASSSATERIHGRDGKASHDESQGAERNRLLKALPAETYERLRPHLEPVHLAVRQVLWEPEVVIRSVYFPRTCVLSILVVLHEDAPVEAATIGHEGMLGAAVALGAESTPARAIAQVPGEGARMPASEFRAALAQDSAMLGLALRYTQTLIDQTSQSVACNRRHTLEERCARWLLMTHDRVGEERFPLTHEFLAYMLGVRRAGVTVAAGTLQKAGLITYTRGKITILDRTRLEEASCECYRIVTDRSDRLLGQDTAAALRGEVS